MKIWRIFVCTEQILVYAKKYKYILIAVLEKLIDIPQRSYLCAFNKGSKILHNNMEVELFLF